MVSDYAGAIFIVGLLMLYLESWLHEVVPKRTQQSAPVGCLFSAFVLTAFALIGIGAVSMAYSLFLPQ